MKIAVIILLSVLVVLAIIITWMVNKPTNKPIKPTKKKSWFKVDDDNYVVLSSNL